MESTRRWTCLALLGVILGVPAAACGGQVLVEGDQDAGATAPPTTSSGSSTGTATATATASACASGSSFGNFPCTAYTAWHYSCPPIAGTSGCWYAVPIGGNPDNGWTNSLTQRQPPGAQLEIVAPTNAQGTECVTLAQCTCDAAGKWQPDSKCRNL
jgi:hypothetical protein